MTSSGKGSTEQPSEITSEEQDPSPEESQESQTLTSPPDGSDLVEEIEVGEGVQTEVQTEFQHPLLKGKSLEEIGRIFDTQQAALNDVTAEANTLHGRLQEQPAAPAPAQEEDAEPYGDDFLAPRFKTFEDRINKSLEKAIAPLRQDIEARGAGSVREGLRQKFKNFEVLEPHIDRLLRERGEDPRTASEPQLNMLYHTALGVAIEQGMDLRSGNAPAPTPTREVPMGIPQHRPSSAPLPAPPTPKKRELTENERILAQEFFGEAEDADEQYRKMQDAEEDGVVAPGFSKEGW